MSHLDSLGLHRSFTAGAASPGTEHVVVRRPLRRVLAFRNRSIDDVVNSRLVKNEIYGYWKVYRQIERQGEVLDLERQWNPLGRRT